MSFSMLAVGDIHAEWGHLNALMSKRQPQYVLQCGDFGWYPSMEPRDMEHYGRTWSLRGLKVPPGCTVHWCDGNHEEHPALAEWQAEGNPVQLYDGVVYQPRGSTLVLPDGRIVLFFGGARSIDKEWRTPGFDWWPEEIPKTGELKRAMEHDHVDIIVSHTCPIEFKMEGFSEDEWDPVRYDLSLLLDRYKPERWFFGHWHVARSGTYRNTKWTALSYPGSRYRWYTEV